MADITLSKAVRSNLLNLQSTANELGNTQERLSTGLKVNSALDNPTNFFTASSLNSRASDLGRLLDSVSNAKSTVDAADKGLTAITNLVESAQATARQALQTSATVDDTTTVAATSGESSGGTFSAVDVSGAGSAATSGTIEGGTFSAVDFENGGSNDGSISFDIAVDGGGAQSVTIDYAAANAGAVDASAVTSAELVSLINDAANTALGTSGVAYAADDGGGDIDISSGTTGAASDVTISSFTVANGATGSGLADAATVTGDAAVAADAISFDVSVDGGAATTITIDDAAVDTYNTANSTTLDSSALTADDVVALVNDQAGASIASNNAGAVDLTSTTTGAASNVTVTSSASTATGGSTGISDGDESGEASTSTTVQVTNPKRDEYVDQYNELLSQIDDLASDASFNGVNLLDGDDLSVQFNEDGSSKLDISGVTFDSAGLGLTELSSGDFDTDADINTTLDDLNEGVDDLRTQASTFGSNLSVVETRQDFTKDLINTLETGAANLTLADTNEEAANLLALQTRQQLSSTALSLASQSDQNVLRLF